MDGIVKGSRRKPGAAQPAARSFRPASPPETRRVAAWAPLAAIIFSGLLFAVAAWLLLQARPWAAP